MVDIVKGKSYYLGLRREQMERMTKTRLSRKMTKHVESLEEQVYKNKYTNGK